jgi:alpha-glucosidase
MAEIFTNSIQDNNYMVNDLGNSKEYLFPGKIIGCKQDGNHFLFTCDSEVALSVTVVTDKIIRFRYAVDGHFTDDFSYATDPDFSGPYTIVECKEKVDHYHITTDRVICTIDKERLRVKVLNRSGTVLSEDEQGFHWEHNFESGGEIVRMSKKVQPGEHYYGLGDKACNSDLRGKRLELWGTDTYGYGKNADPLYKSIPFYIGLHHQTGYGIFFDNSFQSFFDFALERTNVTSFWAQGGEMNYYFIYGPEMVEVVEQYTCLTGKAELPPLWALGYHQCKWSYYPEEVVKKIAAGFRQRRIPCDAIYLDIDYMDGYRCFTWHPEYFPDPKRMVQELAADGFKTVVIIDPGIKIDKNYWVYLEGFANDYFCRRTDGPLMKGSVWPGLCVFPDFTRAEVREWWAGLFEGLLEVGVKGVWNDMNEPAVFESGTFPNDVRHDYDGHPCSHRKAHNVYGMQMARATCLGMKKHGYPHRPFTITRSLYSGAQRYCSTWTGDNVATWEHMWLANIQCQRLSVSGMSFVGSDIGGFIEMPTGEMYIRWLQLGIFHPLCRTHSSGDHGEQEPWSFGERFTDLARKFIELRYQLLPYLYTTFWQYATYGTPMLKPLAFLDQRDPESYGRMAEFGLGDNLLVCPITQAEATGRWMYLPKGSWYHYWTDNKAEGGHEFWIDAGLDQVPLFIKAGAVVPFYPIMQYVGEKEILELTLQVYFLHGRHTSVFYEDQGDGYGHLEGQCSVKMFEVKGTADSITLTQSTEGHYTPSYGTYEILLHGLPFAITDGNLDGAEIDVTATQHIEYMRVQTIRVPRDFREVHLSQHIKNKLSVSNPAG